MASPGNGHCANCIGTLSFYMDCDATPVRRETIVYSWYHGVLLWSQVIIIIIFIYLEVAKRN